MRGEWRSAITTSGAQSVTTSLVLLKHELFAGSLATLLLVSTSIHPLLEVVWNRRKFKIQNQSNSSLEYSYIKA